MIYYKEMCSNVFLEGRATSHLKNLKATFLTLTTEIFLPG